MIHSITKPNSFQTTTRTYASYTYRKQYVIDGEKWVEYRKATKRNVIVFKKENEEKIFANLFESFASEGDRSRWCIYVIENERFKWVGEMPKETIKRDLARKINKLQKIYNATRKLTK